MPSPAEPTPIQWSYGSRSCPLSSIRAERPRRVIATANQKGGVGKTTTVVNLGCALAMAGRRVLIVDLDPQGNASTGLGVARENRFPDSYAVIAGDSTLADATQPTGIDNLWVVPAGADLAGAEVELAIVEAREFRLRQALDGPNDNAAYEFVLIDCPPSLGLLVVNALVAADAVLVPLQCEFFALEGVAQLMATIAAIRQRLNPALVVDGILLTMVDRRSNFSEQVAAEARAHFGPLVWRTAIPRNIRVSEAPSHGKPVLTYDPRSSGALAYVDLAAEFIDRQAASAA